MLNRIYSFFEKEMLYWRYFLLVPINLKLKHISTRTAKFVVKRSFVFILLFAFVTFTLFQIPALKTQHGPILLTMVILSGLFLSIIIWKLRYTLKKTFVFFMIILGILFIHVLIVIVYYTFRYMLKEITVFQ
ncbi:MAG: hypothetical protein PHV30_06390 [Candidatus Margulisbacteria bacterium]|nr:hypothetical protein [Candidatus Margulisiibacteriota bacterium]